MIIIADDVAPGRGRERERERREGGGGGGGGGVQLGLFQPLCYSKLTATSWAYLHTSVHARMLQ
jgi:hypothetical protein